MFDFTYKLQITKTFSIDLDVEVDVDPYEAQTHDCPESDACIRGIQVKFNGVRCEDDLDEAVMESINRMAQERFEDPDFDPPDEPDHDDREYNV